MGKYLLIISCSESKRHEPGLVPAFERYTGAWYGVINKLKRENKLPSDLDILIISAKYGLIRAAELIDCYDQKMTILRARELKSQVIAKLEAIISKTQYVRILVNLGSIYMEAVRGIEDIPACSARIEYLEGRIGQRKKALKNWILTIC